MTDQKKTLESFNEDRDKLDKLTAPRIWSDGGASAADWEYRDRESITYALNMIGHLLERIEVLEADRTTDEDLPMSGGIEGPFIRNDGSEISPFE